MLIRMMAPNTKRIKRPPLGAIVRMMVDGWCSEMKKYPPPCVSYDKDVSRRLLMVVW